MKMHHVLLVRKSVLFSLVMLSPALQAATNEPLNFNYTRADVLSLEPRLALQARACHAVTEPLDINVKLMNISLPRFRVTLRLRGRTFPNSYTEFTGPSITNLASGGAQSDLQMQVPWKVTIQGSVGGQQGDYQTIGATAGKVEYSDRFCFSPEKTDPKLNDLTKGAVPIYYSEYNTETGQRNPYWKKGDWGQYCKGKPDNADDNWWWPDFYNPPTVNYGNDSITANINRKPGGHYLAGLEFLTSHMFFARKDVTLADPGHLEFIGQPYRKTIDPDTYIDQYDHTYDLTDLLNNNDGRKISHVNYGNILVGLNSRVIQSITLTLSDTRLKKQSVFSWDRTLVAGDLPVDNILHFKEKTVSGQGIPVSPFPINVSDYGHYTTFNDPYDSFYKDNVRKNYFRGTMVNGSSLNTNYDKIPLSLPTDITGDINLANTDSLTFIIGKDNFDNVDNDKADYSVLFYGGPMRFGPLYIFNRFSKIASAMQVRNVCY